MTDKSGTTYSAGGATQNSIRFAQWLLQAPGATSYMGCVGKDKYAGILRDTMERAGCKVRCRYSPPGVTMLQQLIKQVVSQALYLEDESAPTGTCATAIMNNERSLVANLAAANNYKVSRCE